MADTNRPVRILFTSASPDWVASLCDICDCSGDHAAMIEQRQARGAHPLTQLDSTPLRIFRKTE
jgi:hypothetical protein